MATVRCGVYNVRVKSSPMLTILLIKPRSDDDRHDCDRAPPCSCNG